MCVCAYVWQAKPTVSYLFNAAFLHSASLIRNYCRLVYFCGKNIFGYTKFICTEYFISITISSAICKMVEAKYCAGKKYRIKAIYIYAIEKVEESLPLFKLWFCWRSSSLAGHHLGC